MEGRKTTGCFIKGCLKIILLIVHKSLKETLFLPSAKLLCVEHVLPSAEMLTTCT